MNSLELKSIRNVKALKIYINFVDVYYSGIVTYSCLSSGSSDVGVSRSPSDTGPRLSIRNIAVPSTSTSKMLARGS